MRTPPASWRASKIVTLWPELGQVAGHGQSGRPGADDGHFLAGRRRERRDARRNRSAARNRPRTAPGCRWPRGRRRPSSSRRLPRTASPGDRRGRRWPAGELVSLSFQAAARNSPFSMSLTKLGMSMHTGQPVTHWGLAQSRQRRASAWAISGVRPRLTSSKSRFRTSGGRSGIFWRPASSAP